MQRDKRFKIIAVLIILTISIWTTALLSSQKTLNVTFLDVGEGLCTVVRTPSGKILVMDCGTSSWGKNGVIGQKLVAPYLQSMGVDRIDVAVLSHPHSDHISGYPGLLKLKPANMVLDIGARHASPVYKRFLTTVKKSGADYRIAKCGQTIDMGDGVSVEVLNPKPIHNYTDLNNHSIAIRVIYKQVAFLLAADTGEEAELQMLESKMKLRSQVLQVGHHGSSDSSSLTWLQAVKPQAAVISCGYKNQYHHPSIETIRRLQNTGTRIYRTDRHGAVSFTTDGSVIRVNTIRKN